MVSPIVKSKADLAREVQNKEAQEIFNKFDVNGDGQLCRREVYDALIALNVPVCKTRLDELMKRLDTGGDGQVSFKEFETFYEDASKRLWNVYRGIATRVESGEGSRGTSRRPRVITAASLRTGMKELGMKASDQEVREMIRRIDLDADGTVSFNEFREVLLFLPEENPAAVFDAWRSLVPLDDTSSEFCLQKDLKFENSEYTQVLARLMSGAVAGAVSRTATAPLDRLKILMQASMLPEPSTSTASSPSCLSPGSGVRVSTSHPSLAAVAAGGGRGNAPGLISGIRFIYAEGGVRAFFRSNGTNVMKIAPETAIKFVTYDAFKSVLSRDPTNPTMIERLLAGGLAGATSQFAIYPLEIAKTRLALSSPGTYLGPLQCMKAVVKHEGWRALYAGLTTSVTGIMPYAGVDLAMNSMLKELASERLKERQEEPGVGTLLACGMLSSSTAMVATYPLGLIRTRLQASGMPGAPRFKGFQDCLSHTLRTDGVYGLYKGMVPNAMKVLPATSISYAVFDLLNRQFYNGS